MRILYAFAAFVGAAWAVGGLAGGDMRGGLAGLAIFGIAGAGLWRDLRDPDRQRRGGHFATVTFAAGPGDGIGGGRGTFARVATREHRVAWNVALDRPPQRGDLEVWGTAQPGWVWLDAEGLPEKVRVDYGSTWKSWQVLDAATAPAASATGS